MNTVIDNIIYVNFARTQTTIEKLLESYIDAPNDAITDPFLKQCKSVLTDDDFADLIDAIIDTGFYSVCDEDIQILVDEYYQRLNG